MLRILVQICPEIDGVPFPYFEKLLRRCNTTLPLTSIYVGGSLSDLGEMYLYRIASVTFQYRLTYVILSARVRVAGSSVVSFYIIQHAGSME